MVGQGIQYMIVGMGVVFAFLVLMVAVMYAASWAIGRLAERFPNESVFRHTDESESAGEDLSAIAAAIAAARFHAARR